MKRFRTHLWLLLITAMAMGLVAAACGDDDDAATEALDFTGQTLTVITHASFAISEATIAAFEDEYGVTVALLPTGDAVESLNRAILTKSNPEGDLLFGVDNVSFVRALDEDLFLEYESPELRNVDDRWVFDDSGTITPIDYGYVLFNYEKAALDAAGLEPPARLAVLLGPEWNGRVAVQDPNTSSPGLHLMLATIAVFGDGWLDWWEEMRANGLIVSASWTDAYYTRFSQYGGDAWLVNSYATSPAAEVIFAETELDESPTGNVIIPNASYLQIEGVGILRNSERVELAKKFIDHMLSQAFQEDIPLNMFVYPVHRDAALPDEFSRFAEVPETVASIDPDEVQANLEDWLDAWTDTVVR
ncbi:MAG TPA: thiamine ABC transporter substrate-binding protein [Dehalococcoidia bacterium]|nr:thiamine ABC transporter substrate-binding protein [Dehalococcoidia bacterium]